MVSDQVVQSEYSEDDLLPLSGLQHLAFCERQCALIHVEGAWDENRLTVMGSLQHIRSDEPRGERRQGVLIRRGMALRSLRLGVVGKADVVEFHPRTPAVGDPLKARLSAHETPLPVEFKHGRPKPDRCDEVQVCAQGICLEEMLGVHVPRGAIFYGQPRRRYQVEFGPSLRLETEQLALRFHEIFAAGITPVASYTQKKCQSCSLLDLCVPRRRGRSPSARRYVISMIAETLFSRSDLDGSQ